MSTIDVVIGANFGDEGKGLMTDYLASKYDNDCTVVRFNGGSQAGHTVVTPEGQRHVFSHFGSGSFTGARTHLSHFFICNPVEFRIELEKLDALNARNKRDPSILTADPQCRITTPYDMILNQGIETKRDKDRHGSCGSGIHETIIRDKQISLRVIDLIQGNYTMKLFEIINYCKLKAQVLELDHKFIKLITNPNVLMKFIQDIQLFEMSITCLNDDSIFAEHVIFEGAQGLLLDEGHEYFPHVTHSKTGMCNVSDLITMMKYNTKDVIPNIYYMSRGYMSRHGAGPFYTEDTAMPYNIVDNTNNHNEWQQTLRLGYLDLGLLLKTIADDLKYAEKREYNAHLVLTCMDQLPDTITILNGGIYMEVTKKQLYKMVEEHFNNIYISEGPTRETIKKVYTNA